jgi:putative endonuclease
MLEERGFVTIERNWRAGRHGEIDLVMKDGECIVFVEVRAKSWTSCGLPEETVGFAKQSKLRKLATMWLANRGLHTN